MFDPTTTVDFRRAAEQKKQPSSWQHPPPHPTPASQDLRRNAGRKVQKVSASQQIRLCGLAFKPRIQKAAMLTPISLFYYTIHVAWGTMSGQQTSGRAFTSSSTSFILCSNADLINESKVGWVCGYRGWWYFLLGYQRGDMQMGQRDNECSRFFLHLCSPIWGNVKTRRKKNIMMQLRAASRYQPVRRRPAGWWWSEASSRDSSPRSGLPPGTGL